MRLTFVALALCCACSADVSDLRLPSVTDPTCMWVEQELIEPADVCRRFTSPDGARFRSLAHDSCDGVACLELGAGQAAVVIREIDATVSWSSDECVGNLPGHAPCASQL